MNSTPLPCPLRVKFRLSGRPMDWKTALPLFLGSSVLAGVISGVIAQGIPVLRDRRARKRLGDFSALRLALLLEDYAGRCSELYGEIQAYITTDGHQGVRHGGLIPLPEYPEDIAWQALGTRLTEKVWGLRAIRSEAGLMVTHEWDDNPFQDDHAGFVGDMAVEIGLKAVTIAEKLRKDRGLSAADEGLRFSTKKILVDQMAAVTLSRQQHEARQAASVAYLNAIAASSRSS